MYAPDAIGGMQIYEDVKEALDIGVVDLTDDDAIDGFAPSSELPKGAVQIGHVIPKWYTNTWPVDENLDPIIDEADVVHVDPDAVAEEIAEQQEIAVTTTAETSVEKFTKKYTKNKQQEIDAVIEDAIEDEVITEDEVEDNIDDTSDQSVL